MSFHCPIVISSDIVGHTMPRNISVHVVLTTFNMSRALDPGWIDQRLKAAKAAGGDLCRL